MISVLLIALEFPPVQTAGAFRSFDFARYLPEFGIKPIVVTIDPEHGAAIFKAPINEGLISGLPDAVEIVHIASHKMFRPETRLQEGLRIYTTFDDGYFKRYRDPLLARLSDVMQRHKIAALYVTAPPFGAARLGEMAARVLGVPWVLDMRDAWAEWGATPNPTYLHYYRRSIDESRSFASATAVITVTDRLRQVFRNSHPSLPPEKFHVIANGYDGLAIEGGSIVASPAHETFDISYVGSYYYTPTKPRSWRRPHAYLQYQRGTEDWSYRSPLYFFRAWQALRSFDPKAAGCLRYHHIGTAPEWLLPMAAAHGVANQCIDHGRVSKQQVAKLLEAMDAHLSTSMKRHDGGDFCLASKTFDYIASRKPILAFVTDGSQRDFLCRSGAAVMCNPDDAIGSARTLSALVRSPPVISLDGGFLGKFHRRTSAQQLAAVLHHVASGTPLPTIEAIA